MARHAHSRRRGDRQLEAFGDHELRRDNKRGKTVGTFPVNATIDNTGTIVGTGDRDIFAVSNTESVELVLWGMSVL